MGLALSVFRTANWDIGAGISDIYDLVATNLPGTDEANEFAPAVHLVAVDKIACLVPVEHDGALRWGRPSRNFAGAIDNASWLEATRQLTGSHCPLVRIFDQPHAPGFEFNPEALVLPGTIVSVSKSGATPDSLAADLFDHLQRRAQAHGIEDAAVVLDGALVGAARFIAAVNGHGRVRTAFMGFVEVAERSILAEATPESEVRQ